MSKRRIKHDRSFPSPSLILPGERLWLPGDPLRKRSFGKRNLLMMPAQQCCCPEPGCETCTCEECSDSPFYAPCCWKVVIVGIVDGSCADCEVLNKTYYLSQDDPAGCTWSEGAVCGDCDPTDIILTVTLDGSDYIITVTMGGHVWQKNYGTSKPECCGLTDETIAHLTNSGDCDSSSATCVISALADGHPCETATCIGDCSNCDDPPEEVAVDLGVFGLSNNACDACTTITGVFAAPQAGDCAWTFCADSWCTANQCQNANPGDDEYTLAITADITGTTTLQWRVIIQLNGGFTCSGGGSFWGLKWAYRSATWLFGDDPNCFSLADEDGKISLSRSFGDSFNSCPGNGKTPLCGNEDSVPGTIHLWDANAP